MMLKCIRNIIKTKFFLRKQAAFDLTVGLQTTKTDLDQQVRKAPNRLRRLLQRKRPQLKNFPQTISIGRTAE